MKRLSVLIAVSLFMGTFAISLQAQDFTFNVPVELHNIPSFFYYFHVVANVYKSVPDAQGMHYQGDLVGSGRTTDIRLQSGEYVGTVVVQFNAAPGLNPADAKYYDVMLELLEDDGVGGRPSAVMSPDGLHPYDPSKPLVEFLQGPLSQKPLQTASVGTQISTQVQNARERAQSTLSGIVQPAGPSVQARITNFVVVERSGASLTFTVNYAYRGPVDEGYTMGAVAVAKAAPITWITCKDVGLKAAPRGTIQLTIAPIVVGRVTTHQTDQVRVILRYQGKEVASAVFDCPMTWPPR